MYSRSKVTNTEEILEYLTMSSRLGDNSLTTTNNSYSNACPFGYDLTGL